MVCMRSTNYCKRSLSGSQIDSRVEVITGGVGNSTVAHNIKERRPRHLAAHRLLRAFFELQMKAVVWLRLQVIPIEVKFKDGCITRPVRNEFLRLRRHVFTES